MKKTISGETKSGFSYSIEEGRLNNYELLEQIGDLDQNPLAISKVVVMLLGNEQTNKLKDHLRDKDGLVPIEKMTEEVTEIFQSKSVKK